MRLSPVLVAAIAASATLGLTHPAKGQTSEPTSTGTEHPEVSVVAATPQQEPLKEATSDNCQASSCNVWLEIASHSSQFESAITINQNADFVISLNPHSDGDTPDGTLRERSKEEKEFKHQTLGIENLSLADHQSVAADFVISLNPHSDGDTPDGTLRERSKEEKEFKHQEASNAAVTLTEAGKGNQNLSEPSAIASSFSLSHHHDPISSLPPNSQAQTSTTPPPTETNPPTAPVTPETTPSETQTPPSQSNPTPPSGSNTQELNLPQQQPTAPLGQPPSGQPAAGQEAEPLVLVAEVDIQGVTGELQNIIYNAIRTQPGRTTTRTQLQQDINAIFATGYFAKVRVTPQDTPLGVRVTFVVEPNPVLRSVQLDVAQVVPEAIVNQIFASQYGRTLNLRDLQEAIKQLNKWYQDRGYVLAQVVDSQVSPEGVVTLKVAEGVVEDIQVRFLNKEGEATDDQGRPIRGRTRSYIVRREMALKPGQVFNRNQIQQDLQRVFRLGLFQDVQLSLNPGTDPRQVVVVVNVKERSYGSIAAGAGYSTASGLFGSLSFQQQNVGGNNQTLASEIQLGTRDLLFDLSFTDPWIGGDPYRTSYTVNFFRRRSISLIFDGGDPDVDLPDGDTPRVLRLGGGVTFNRPLAKNPLVPSEWVASLGVLYQRVSIQNSDGDISPRDEYGNDLSWSGEGKDDLTTVALGLLRDRRNSIVEPTQGSFLRLGLEQSIPLGLGNVFMTRLRGSYSHYIPVRFTSFNKGPQTLAFNVQAGTILFDLPPYEAFPLGGTNSVRGYKDGDVGSARSFVQGTVEYRFPLFSFLGGVLFLDIASDLGTDSSVPGEPAVIRGKPGWGLGYGVGVRIKSPLGPIRIDYGFNNEGDSRIHFGVGERF